MSSVVSNAGSAVTDRAVSASVRSGLLADRLEQGARELAAFAGTLSEAEWATPLPKDGRPVGVVVNHVASVYPIEIQLAQTVAAGTPVTGVTGKDIDAMNAAHAAAHATVGKAATIELLLGNSAAAAAAIRAMTEADLDRAATVSLYDNAPLTCQFVLEDHAVRHSYHHLAGIRAAVRR
jgi:DinB superfamily